MTPLQSPKRDDDRLAVPMFIAGVLLVVGAAALGALGIDRATVFFIAAIGALCLPTHRV